jgi:hypothetical protein
MTNVSKALTGKRVYRMSSYAPTRGTNNPKGYVERELRNRTKPQKVQKQLPQKRAEPIQKKIAGTHGVSKVGKDGQSDTRSGLAASTLNKPNRRRRRRSINDSFQKFNRAPLTTPRYKPIAINSNGRLDLPFDYAAGQGALERQQEANSNLLDLQRQTQEHATSYLQQMRNSQQNYGQVRRQTLNSNAARGSAFSSAYGTAVGRNATDYNNQVNDLNADNTLFNNGVAAQRNDITAGLNDFLRQQALQRGVALGSKAGTLGFGKAKVRNALGKKTRRRRRPVR